MSMIIQTSPTPTATINTCGGPHPAGSLCVPGAGTMTFHPLHGPAGTRQEPMEHVLWTTHTFLCARLFPRGLSAEELAKAAVFFVCLFCQGPPGIC